MYISYIIYSFLVSREELIKTQAPKRPVQWIQSPGHHDWAEDPLPATHSCRWRNTPNRGTPGNTGDTGDPNGVSLKLHSPRAPRQRSPRGMLESQDTPREPSSGSRMLENAWNSLDFLIKLVQRQVGWVCPKSGHKLLEPEMLYNVPMLTITACEVSLWICRQGVGNHLACGRLDLSGVNMCKLGISNRFILWISNISNWAYQTY